jgi:hypothetical protein
LLSDANHRYQEDYCFLHHPVSWLRLSEQLRTKDKWIPAGFGWWM